MSSEIIFNSNWIDKSQAVNNNSDPKEQQPETQPEIKAEKPKRKTATKAKLKKEPKAKVIKPRAKKVVVKAEEINEPIVNKVETTNENDIKLFDDFETKQTVNDAVRLSKLDNSFDVNEFLSSNTKRKERERLFDFEKKKNINYSQMGYLAVAGLALSFLL